MPAPLGETLGAAVTRRATGNFRSEHRRRCVDNPTHLADRRQGSGELGIRQLSDPARARKPRGHDTGQFPQLPDIRSHIRMLANAADTQERTHKPVDNSAPIESTPPTATR